MKPSLTVRNATDADKKIWDTLAVHPLQSWAWGDFRKKQGTTVARFIVETNTVPTDVWQMTFHPIPFTHFTIGYFPKGPLPTKEMARELTEIGKKYHALFIQLEPNTIQEIEKQSDKDIKNKNKISQYLNISISSLQKSHHPLFTKYTFVLDLTKSEEELLKAMHSKTRYNIKVAQKHGIVVKEDNSKEAFNAYLQLSQETTNRQGFYAHNTTYHQTMWQIMRDSGIAHLWTASYNDEILATWIIFAWGKTLYYPYGASSRNHREVMAPNLLLWEIVKWGKKKGYASFDLWGALGPSETGEPDVNDPWYGFHRFKEGYHPDLVEFIGSYDLIIQPSLYKLYCLLDTLRWRILKLKTKL